LEATIYNNLNNQLICLPMRFVHHFIWVLLWCVLWPNKSEPLAFWDVLSESLCSLFVALDKILNCSIQLLVVIGSYRKVQTLQDQRWIPSARMHCLMKLARSMRVLLDSAPPYMR
jgi:hypothetical protein